MQCFGSMVRYRLGLSDQACAEAVALLNPILADTAAIRDLYKKHHWQVSGPTFYQLHLLYDNYAEQSQLVDSIAERIQMLGGIAVAMPHDIIEISHIERPPKGREEVPVQLSRLLEAHEVILKEAHSAAQRVVELGDDGTNDLLAGEVIRLNEMQVWFLSEHLVDTPLVGRRIQ
jgi:starvation-inducible DNA-binding protein